MEVALRLVGMASLLDGARAFTRAASATINAIAILRKNTERFIVAIWFVGLFLVLVSR